MDTTGDFSIERVTDLIMSHEGEVSADFGQLERLHVAYYFSKKKKQAVNTALQRLKVSLVFDIEAAHDILEALPSALSVSAWSHLVISYLMLLL